VNQDKKLLDELIQKLEEKKISERHEEFSMETPVKLPWEKQPVIAQALTNYYDREIKVVQTCSDEKCHIVCYCPATIFFKENKKQAEKEKKINEAFSHAIDKHKNRFRQLIQKIGDLDGRPEKIFYIFKEERGKTGVFEITALSHYYGRSVEVETIWSGPDLKIIFGEKSGSKKRKREEPEEGDES
jgi:hypothetical protein